MKSNEMSEKDRQKCVEILHIMYLRIMQLKFSRCWVNAITFDPHVERYCPDMSYCLQWMFATNAYVTIDAMFSSGLYSFVQLYGYDDGIESRVSDAKVALNAVIPGFHNIRNRMFAHANYKRDGRVVNNIFLKFEDVFCIVANLQNYCRYVLNITDEDIGGYKSEVFYGMDEQISMFRDVVMRGFMSIEDEKIRELISGAGGH